MRTVAGRFYRCGSVWNGAGESPAVPKGLGRCFRAWNGAGGPVAVFYGYNTVTKAEMLPEALRHRYRRDNRKKMRDCLTLPGGRLSASFVSRFALCPLCLCGEVFILLSQIAIKDARTQSLPLPVLTPPYSIA